MSNFHFLSGKVLFSTMADDDEPPRKGKSIGDAQFSIFHLLNYNFTQLEAV